MKLKRFLVKILESDQGERESAGGGGDDRKVL